MMFKCVVCGKSIQSQQPNIKYCSECKYKRELERQRERYFKSGLIALNEILKRPDNYFLLGCEEVYNKLRGVKIDKKNNDCMVQERLNQLKKLLKNIKSQIEKIENYIEDDK